LLSDFVFSAEFEVEVAEVGREPPALEAAAEAAVSMTQEF
jgi:hypothetical protein